MGRLLDGVGMERAQALIQVLEETIALLRRCGESQWAGLLESDLALMEAGDGYGLERLLRRFGGMGSFTDLWLDETNGHRVPVDETVSVNEQLSRLRSLMYAEAKALERKAR